MATPKSPFMVLPRFISPKVCEHITDQLGFYSPDLDVNGDPIKMYRHHEQAQDIIYTRLKSELKSIETHYKVEHKGTEQMIFEYLTAGVASEPLCENSNYLRNKWVRTKDRDLTALLFLSEFNDKPPFDNDYEVYGGKLEFPQHNFSFQPVRGTLVIYPSGPHFINANSAIFAGELIQVRIHLATKLPFLYDPREFPGDYRTWLRAFM